jgi:hypothetical protein
VKVTDKKDTLTSETWTFKAQEGSTTVQDFSGLPIRYSLGQAKFNPYSRIFTVPFALPKAGQVTLTLYDGLGNQTGILSKGYRKAGYYGLSFDASPFRGQLYFYKMEAGNFSAVRKMVLIR